MELSWFYIALMLAISDEIHSLLTWNLFRPFYTIFGGFVQGSVYSNLQVWLVHEGLEALFHFIILVIVFLSIEIGFLAAIIHFIIDGIHSLTVTHINHLEHRALHFLFESLFFICIFGL